ncbi:transcriptional regulator [Cenarchaeum symbiosum A]|uniref:Transcriptional regulator n=1 Tax=Cenarchaeum symbiosum (strain A) TaxID=414004 RepID=A0RVT7_CENSY|nr:transcriptional regulator [Cenarchaeum symbiosum A]
MSDDGALSAGLGEFGLSQYEARAYVALLSMGTASAGELSYRSGLPRTKVYPVLARLQKRGLVSVSEVKPVTCSAIPPGEALGEAVERQAGRASMMGGLLEELSRVSEAAGGPDSTEGRYHNVDGIGAAARLESMACMARKTIHVMAAGAGLELLAGCSDGIKSLLGNGGRVRVVMPPDLIGSEQHCSLPPGVEVRAADVLQEYFVFDGASLLVLGTGGNGAAFDNSDTMGSWQEGAFLRAWEGAAITGEMDGMSSAGVREACGMVRLVGEGALGRVLSCADGRGFGLLGLLEDGGIILRGRNLGEVIRAIDAALRISCGGHASLDSGARSVSIESGLNSGSSLPWASILDEYLRDAGHETRMTHQGIDGGGERVHLRFGAGTVPA